MTINFGSHCRVAWRLERKKYSYLVYYYGTIIRCSEPVTSLRCDRMACEDGTIIHLNGEHEELGPRTKGLHLRSYRDRLTPFASASSSIRRFHCSGNGQKLHSPHAAAIWSGICSLTGPAPLGRRRSQTSLWWYSCGGSIPASTLTPWPTN
jgi:hypothetical protein